MNKKDETKTGKQKVEEARSKEAFEMARVEYKKIGSRIASIRKAQEPKVTQQSLAEKAGFSFDYVSRIEQGKARPTMEALCELACVLGVEVKEFFIDQSEKGSWNLKPEGLVVELSNQEGETIRQNFKLLPDQ